jgi:hypothetical protein
MLPFDQLEQSNLHHKLSIGDIGELSPHELAIVEFGTTALKRGDHIINHPYLIGNIVQVYVDFINTSFIYGSDECINSKKSNFIDYKSKTNNLLSEQNGKTLLKHSFHHPSYTLPQVWL